MGLGALVALWLVTEIVDARHDSRRKLANFRQGNSEWVVWIGSSCKLPTDLTVALSAELATWSPSHVSELLSDFVSVRAREAAAWSQLQPSVRVPTELADYIRYRLRQATTTLPTNVTPNADVIDQCAKSIHDAMIEFGRDVKQQATELLSEEAEQEKDPEFNGFTIEEIDFLEESWGIQGETDDLANLVEEVRLGKSIEREWEYWISLSCDLPTELTEGLSWLLSLWEDVGPRYLLSDFNTAREYHAAVNRAAIKHMLDRDLHVPSRFDEFIEYLFLVSADMLPDPLQSAESTLATLNCAKDVHREMKPFRGVWPTVEVVDYQEYP